MKKYRHVVFKTDEGFHYDILPVDSDVPVVSSGAFLRREDADTVGAHFASDNDLEIHLKR